jgi:glycerol uptake facilitator-like aquaporin
MRTAPLSRLWAEVLGTAVLVFFGVGALVVAKPNAAIAAAGIFVAAALAAWIFGGHFNPWITIGSAVRGSTSWSVVPVLILAQLVGGFAGALGLWAIYGQVGINAGLGANHLAEAASSGKGLVAALVAEAVAVFVLCLVVFAAGDSDRGPVATAMAYAAGTLTIFVVTGASLNFARTLGPELTLAIGGGKADWSNIWVYLVGPLIGAVLAGLAYTMVTSSKTAEAPAK